jgi:hypothetical protein
VARTTAAIGGETEVTLVPGTQTTPVNQAQSVAIQTDLHGIPVDGIQVVVNFQGALPTNLAFTPATIAGLNTVTNVFNVSSPTAAKLTLAFLPSSVPTPYTHTGALTLGQFYYAIPQTQGVLSQRVLKLKPTL